MRGEQPSFGWREQSSLILWGSILMSDVWSTIFSKSETVGPRKARSPYRAGSFLVCAGWAVTTQSEALGFFLAAALLCQLDTLLKSRKFRGHSRDIGESWLSRLARGDQWKARAYEVFLAFFGGLLLSQWDYGLGSYLVCAGIGHAVVIWWIRARDEAIDQDIRDSREEAAWRARRLGDDI